MNQAVLIVGATSAIARAIAQELAADKHDLILAARDQIELDRIAADLRVRGGITAAVLPFDAADSNSSAALWSRSLEIAGGEIVGVVIAHAFMPPQAEALSDMEVTRRVIDTNFTSAAQILSQAADYFETQHRKGFLCGISSVAGDRGRQSNYLYGSTKAALTTFLSGLRNRLSRSDVAVITVKPGFVDTAMTWGLPGLFLVASPEKVAADIVRRIRGRRSCEMYTPWFWRWIMLIIKSMPEPIFKRMKL